MANSFERTRQVAQASASEQCATIGSDLTNQRHHLSCARPARWCTIATRVGDESLLPLQNLHGHSWSQLRSLDIALPLTFKLKIASPIFYIAALNALALSSMSGILHPTSKWPIPAQ
jgi:hypothetical protein